VVKKLRPGLSWPTKPAIVTAVLGPLTDDVRVVWMSWQQQARDPVHVVWEPIPRGGTEDLDHVGASLWISPIDRSQLDTWRLKADEVLQEVRSWLENALHAGEAWQSSKQERRWRLHADGSVTTHDDSGMHILDRERGQRGRYRAPSARPTVYTCRSRTRIRRSHAQLTAPVLADRHAACYDTEQSFIGEPGTCEVSAVVRISIDVCEACDTIPGV